MASDPTAASGREAPASPASPRPAGRKSPAPSPRAPRRIVAVWLPWWPTERLAARGRTPNDRTGSSDAHPAPDNARKSGAHQTRPSESPPFVTVGESRNRLVIEACNPPAVRAGLKPGMALADGRAIVPDVLVRPADPQADALALERLARWATRFTPRVMPDGAGAILLDIAGCTRLFGGEEALLASLRATLRDFRLTARLAVADTAGAAWALARFGPDDPGVAPAGAGPSGIGRALARLPVAALRLDPDTARELASFGLDRIGRLSAMAPAQLTRRFGPQPVRRLEQALGLADEPITPLCPLPRRTAHRAFADPISTVADIRRAVDGLLDDLCQALHRSGEGARRLHLVCHRVDGRRPSVTVGTSRPLRRRELLLALFDEKLEQIRPGFGIDEVVLAAEVVEGLSEMQTDWLGDAGGGRRAESEEALADLFDRMGNRLGFGRIERPAPRQSWLPERATRRGRTLRMPQAVADGHDHVGAGASGAGGHRRPRPSRHGPHDHASEAGAAPGSQSAAPSGWPPRRRPLRLLSPPEPVQAVALEPDGAPLAFRRRGRLHRLRAAEGPERLECEWWREEAPLRDYYLVEDEEGGRYWLYRTGCRPTAPRSPQPLCSTSEQSEADRPTPRWFLHGIF